MKKMICLSICCVLMFTLMNALAEGDVFEAAELATLSAYKQVEAKVTGADDKVTLLTINQGTNSGIAVGMPVLTKDGLVGIVSKADAETAQVKTLLNAELTNLCVAFVDASRDTAPLALSASEKETAIYLLDPHPDTNAQPGNAVYTAGVLQVFPKGLLIGHVAAADVLPEEGATKIELAADLANLETVSVLLCPMP